MKFSNLEGKPLPFTLIADANRDVVTKLGMLDPAEKDAAGLPLAARAVLFQFVSFSLHVAWISSHLPVLYLRLSEKSFEKL